MKKNFGHSTLLVCLTENIKKIMGLEHSVCLRIAGTAINTIAKTTKRNRLYIAAKDPEEIAERRAVIRRDYDGTRASRERLQRKFDISKATFYRIIKADDSPGP